MLVPSEFWRNPHFFGEDGERGFVIEESLKPEGLQTITLPSGHVVPIEDYDAEPPF